MRDKRTLCYILNYVDDTNQGFILKIKKVIGDLSTGEAVKAALPQPIRRISSSATHGVEILIWSHMDKKSGQVWYEAQIINREYDYGYRRFQKPNRFDLGKLLILKALLDRAIEWMLHRSDPTAYMNPEMFTQYVKAWEAPPWESVQAMRYELEKRLADLTPREAGILRKVLRMTGSTMKYARKIKSARIVKPRKGDGAYYPDYPEAESSTESDLGAGVTEGGGERDE